MRGEPRPCAVELAHASEISIADRVGRTRSRIRSLCLQGGCLLALGLMGLAGCETLEDLGAFRPEPARAVLHDGAEITLVTTRFAPTPASLFSDDPEVRLNALDRD